jgi:adenine-specific DNA-methyltransferase
LLLYTCEGRVDLIYIDPPYNTGARDWKYNNNYVDANDQWRHSKWLSMMKKRLVLAKRLLKHDGVLIVTIDEN